MGLKKKELERMFRQALAAFQQPNKYETQFDSELAKMDEIIKNKDFSNLPTEYAPNFRPVAEAQKQREKLADLHQTGVGAWASGGKALEPIKQVNASLYAREIQGANEDAVKDFVENRNQLRMGLLGQAAQRNKGSLDIIGQLYGQKMSQPSFWGSVGKMAIGTGLNIAANKFI